MAGHQVSAEVEEFKTAGNECMKSGRYTAAIENYKRGLKLDPRNAVLNCNLAQAHLSKKEFHEAESCAKCAIEANPTYVKGYYRAAKAALGRHCIYDAMLYLADGAANCSGTGLEDLFAMARELSPEFENSLRRCQKQPPTPKPESSQTSQTGQKVEDDDWDRKLDEKSKKKRDLEKKQELLKQQNKEITDALERESRELEELAQKKKEQERLRKEKELQGKRERELEAKKARELAERKAREMEEAKARELKLMKARELEKSKKRAEEEKIQKELERITALKDQVYSECRDGSAALMKGFGRKAVDKFEKALDTIRSHPSDAENLGFSDPMDIVVLQCMYSQALIESGEYTDILKGIKVLEGLELGKQHLKFPAILLLLGKALLRLNRFKEALLPVMRGLAFIERGTPFPRFPWPGTHDVIDVTERSQLKEELLSAKLACGIYHKPDAQCFYEKCGTTSNQHIIPSRNIFFSDPDFNGFLTIVCSENCNIHFHLSCWKDFREHLSIEKLSEKDFLTRDCFTPDCSAVVVKLAITGPDGEIKSQCECAPPVRAHTFETTPLSKSPIKKQRKKEFEKDNKHDHSKKKRTRCDSKSQDFKTDNLIPKNNFSQGNSNIQYSDAMAKLIEARANNFGYQTDPDSLNVGDNPVISIPPHLNQNEEFIYSYFYEIFKKNGHMSVYALQEHWEANRELLPELDPALVTHTDLVKFLLDTEGFAVVEDRIGISSDLPKISAVVESKSEPLPAVDWQFSPATVQEASQTLSFNSALPETYEEVDTRAADLIKQDCDKSSSSSYHSISEDGFKEEISCIDLDGSSNGLLSFDHTSNHGKVAYVNGYNSADNVNSEDSSDSYCDKKPTLPLAVESSKAQSSIDLRPVKGKNRLSNLPPGSIGLSEKMANIKVNEETNNNCKARNPVVNDKSMQNHPSEQSSPRTASWKPRAKLLEWACETFPDEPKCKLWDALTKVRAENNFTLSGLSFDAIGERVRSVLRVNST